MLIQPTLRRSAAAENINTVAVLDRFHQPRACRFDRILVAQSIVEGILLLTTDPLLAQYPAPVRRV